MVISGEIDPIIDESDGRTVVFEWESNVFSTD